MPSKILYIYNFNWETGVHPFRSAFKDALRQMVNPFSLYILGFFVLKATII